VGLPSRAVKKKVTALTPLKKRTKEKGLESGRGGERVKQQVKQGGRV